MRKNITPNTFFYTLAITSIIVFFVQIFSSGIITGGTLFFANPADSFMDFYNVMASVATGRPYDCGGLFIYPPFVGLLMLPFASMIPADMLLANHQEMAQYTSIPLDLTINGAHIVRSTQSGLVALVLFFLITIACLSILIVSLHKGSLTEKRITLLIVLFSGGFLFEYERSNTIILAVIFLIFFICFKDSQNRILRELSLIALACAAGVKVYPAVFGLLLLRDKRWADALKAIIYGALVMFVPFSFFGGIGAVKSMFITLAGSNSGTFQGGLSYKVDLINSLRTLGLYFNVSDALIIRIGSKLTYLLVVLAIPAVCFIKKQWKAVAIVTLAVILTPSFNFYYAMVYAVIPLIIFLNEKETKKMGYIYAAAFALLLSPVFMGVINEINGVSTGSYSLLITSMLQNLCAVILYVSLILEGWIQFIKWIGSRSGNTLGKSVIQS